MGKFFVDPDIKKASTLDSSFYTSSKVYKKCKKEFNHTWQFVGDTFDLDEYNCVPITTNEEELLLTKKENQISCMSNVCTHRGNILIKKSQNLRKISCRYHGKCFGLDGSFQSMPEFETAEDFPTKKDDLKNIPLKFLDPFIFICTGKAKKEFLDWTAPIMDKMSWYPYDKLVPARDLDEVYYLDANWALYCDNYLEGFHVPFVHKKLNETIDYGSYTTEVFDECILQTGIAKEDEQHFTEAQGYKGTDKVYAYYWFLFPNLMINYYTWGISVNIIKPINKNQTEIIFKTYLIDGFSKEDFEQTSIDNTQIEDEEIVLDVQKGVRSKYYSKGRYSPTKEQGVHHFHRLLSIFI